MIADLAPSEVAWLRAFFSAPNGLEWEGIEDRSAPQALIDHVLPWLHLISSGNSQAAIVLPFVRSGQIVGWYATTRGPIGALELKKELMGWLGPTYFEHFDVVPLNTRDSMAAILRQRYNGVVYRFSGAVGTKSARMADLLTTFARLASRRPLTNRMPTRPVGAVRSDFERALLVQDAERAEALLTELRGTGRLNEENLR